ncbi:helix-turn-helix protein [anaerobic digester metagenome]
MELKDKIKELRLARKLSQRDLALKLDELKSDKRETDTYVQTISGWENGREPNLTYLVKLAKVFNVSTDYLLGLSDEENLVDIMYERYSTMDLDRLKVKMREFDRITQEGALRRITHFYSSMIDGAEMNTLDPWSDTQLAKAFYLGEFASRFETVIIHILYGDDLISTDKDAFLFGIGGSEKSAMTAMSEITELILELYDVSSGHKSIRDVIEDRGNFHINIRKY